MAKNIVDIITTVRLGTNSRYSNLELFVSNLIAAIQVYEIELGYLWNAFFNFSNDLNIHFDVRIIYIVESDEVSVVQVRLSVVSWLEY